LPCGHNFQHAIEEDGAENSALVQDPPVSHGLMFLLRLQAYRLFFPAAKVWDAEKNVKGNFLKTPYGNFFKKFPSDAFSFIDCLCASLFGIKLTCTP
jgi:hypothetical protein